MDNPVIQTDLAEILRKLDSRFDKLENRLEKIDDRLGKLEVGQAELKVKVDGIDKTATELKNTQKTLTADVADLKGAKSLIIPIVVAVITSILTLIIRAIVKLSHLVTKATRLQNAA